MTPTSYVNEIVVPTMREFYESPRDRRRAYLACITVFHVKDHVAKALEAAGQSPPKGAIERKMEHVCGDAFLVVQAVCNGTKHVASSVQNGISFQIGSDWERPPARFGAMQFGVSTIEDTKGGRSVRRRGVGMDLYCAARISLISFVYAFPDQLEGASLIGLEELD